MLSTKKQVVLSKLLQAERVRKLQADIRQKDEIIKQLKGLIKFMERTK